MFDTSVAASITIAPPHPTYTSRELPAVILRTVREVAQMGWLQCLQAGLEH